MKIGIVISAIDPENLWNAFRFGTFTQKKGDQVTVFLIGKGVDCYTKDTEQFKITEQMDALVAAGGVINAWGTCLKIRQLPETTSCSLSTMQEMYDLVRESDRIVSF